MIYIIILIVVVAIIGTILKSMFDYLSDIFGPALVIGTLVICVIAFLVYSWKGVLIAFVSEACIVAVGVLISHAGDQIAETVEKHDRSKRETAILNQQTELNKETHINELMLKDELDKNCRWLGYMNDSLWAKKLPNYVNKRYETSFSEITDNFARQLEYQNITQNDDWFKPFLQYIIDHPQGSTAMKMLNEVMCPQFKATHCSPNISILNERLTKGTKEVSGDVPPWLDATPVGNDILYTPTRYLLKIRGKNQSGETEMYQEEISFDDL